MTPFASHRGVTAATPETSKPRWRDAASTMGRGDALTKNTETPWSTAQRATAMASACSRAGSPRPAAMSRASSASASRPVPAIAHVITSHTVSSGKRPAMYA